MDTLAHFGFRKTPFTQELSPDEHLPLPHLDKARTDIKRAVERRLPAALIAPAGTGKTTVLRLLRNDLPDARYLVRYVKVTNLSKRDFCREIAAACSLRPVGTYPNLVRRAEPRGAAGGRRGGRARRARPLQPPGAPERRARHAGVAR